MSFPTQDSPGDTRPEPFALRCRACGLGLEAGPADLLAVLHTAGPCACGGTFEVTPEAEREFATLHGPEGREACEHCLGPVQALSTPTRVDQARAAQQAGAVMGSTLVLICRRCRDQVDRDAVGPRGTCKRCLVNEWDFALEVTATTGPLPVERGLRLAGNAIGILSTLTLGAGLSFALEDDDDPTRKWVRTWSEDLPPGLAAEVAEAATHVVAVRCVLDHCHARELSQRAQQVEGIQREGVHCLACQAAFLPRSIAERHGHRVALGGDDQVCGGPCAKALRALLNAPCPTCGQDFTPPAPRALQKDWKASVWHAAGYCSRACHEGRERKRTCGGCAKPFVIPKPSPLAKRAPMAWHAEGFCSKRCHKGMAPPTRPRPRTAAPGPQLLSTCCPAGHRQEVPERHCGRLTYCAECAARFRVLPA